MKPTGLITQSKNRQTGTITSVYDSKKSGIDIDAKWVTVCEDHSTLVTTGNQKDALGLKARPILWCSECQKLNNNDNG